MKFLFILLMLGVFSIAIVGCEASMEVDDPDGDSSRTTTIDRDDDGYKKTTTVKDEDGDTVKKTEVREYD
jgi:hypothetical protein